MTIGLCLWCCIRCVCCRRRRRPGPKYSSQPSVFHSAPFRGYQPAPEPPIYEPPQYAQFNAGPRAKANEDALPAMPTQEAAIQKQVLLEQPAAAVELEKIRSPQSPQGAYRSLTPTPRIDPTGSQPRSPHSRSPSLYPLDARPVGANEDYIIKKPQKPQSPSPVNPYSFGEPPEPLLPVAPYASTSATASDPSNPFQPPQPPYAAYSPAATMPHEADYSPISSKPGTPFSPSDTGTPRPYKAYSSASSSSVRRGQSSASAVSTADSYHDPLTQPSVTPGLHDEPKELSTPYNKRPDSLLLSSSSAASPSNQPHQSPPIINNPHQHQPAQTNLQNAQYPTQNPWRNL